MKWFVSAITTFNEKLGEIVKYLVFVIMALMLSEIVVRRFLNMQNIWGYESIQFCFGAFFILAGGFALSNRKHITMDILYNRFSPRNRAIIDLVTSLLFFFGIGLLVWVAWDAGLVALMKGQKSDSIWGPPLAPMKLLIAFGCTLLLLQGIARFITDLETVMGKNK